MKKYLLIILSCLFCLCGCNSNDGYQISELTPSSDVLNSYLKGTLKNVSNEDCDSVKISFTYSNGSLKESDYFIISSPKVGETIELDEIILGAGSIDNFENYKIKVDEIKCFLKK